MFSFKFFKDLKDIFSSPERSVIKQAKEIIASNEVPDGCLSDKSRNAKIREIAKMDITLSEKRALLPTYVIPRREIVLPDGTTTKSLFMDYVPDPNYILAKIFKNIDEEYQEEIKAGGGKTRRLLPTPQFSSYN